MNDVIQVLTDCPNCLTESAVVELIDPSIAEGVPVESRCRLCGREEALGKIIFGGRSFERIEDAHHALSDWAEVEGYSSTEAFCQANFSGLGRDEASQRLLDGLSLETNFDVMAYLFPSMSRRSSGRGQQPSTRVSEVIEGHRSAAAIKSAPLPIVAPREEAPGSEPPARVVQGAPQMVAARALSAVMMADGRIRRGELEYLAQTLQEMGLPALVDEDVRSWRPADLPDPADPIPVLRAMVGLAYIDRHRDGTEWRVIREFARYWRVPMNQIEAMGLDMENRRASQVAVLWRGLKSLFVMEGR